MVAIIDHPSSLIIMLLCLTKQSVGCQWWQHSKNFSSSHDA
jgi:hypothetical protein